MTKYHIKGIPKHELLKALYDNAKKSTWTIATIENAICPDKEVLEMLRDKFQEKIDAQISKLGLNDTEASTALNLRRNRIDYIGPVLIKMNFSGDELDLTEYNKAHCEAQGTHCERAENIIAKLKLKYPDAHVTVTARMKNRL